MILAITLAMLMMDHGVVVRCLAAGSPSQELAKATALFSGRVIGHDYIVENMPTGEPAQRVIVNIAVARVWKGNIKPNIIVHTWEYLLPNGYTRIFGENFKFEDDTEYLIYAFGKPDHLWVDQCSRTRKLSNAGDDLKELGDGHEPPPNNSLGRSGGSVFRIELGAAKVAWICAARSTQTSGCFDVISRGRMRSR